LITEINFEQWMHSLFVKRWYCCLRTLEISVRSVNDAIAFVSRYMLLKNNDPNLLPSLRKISVKVLFPGCDVTQTELQEMEQLRSMVISIGNTSLTTFVNTAGWFL
jgi:hypothetical protein